MKIVPQDTQILGRIVDLTKSKGGIVLPDSNVKNVTVFVLIDEVGPLAQRFQRGQIVLPHTMSHIWLRGGQHHRVLFAESEVRAVIEEVSLDQFTIEGETEERQYAVEAQA